MTRHAVVVVHGLWMPASATWLLARRLRDAEHATYRYGYHSVAADLGTNVELLAAYLARVPGDRLDLVGHSLGGVVILKLLEQGLALERPGRVVCLGSPLLGSRAAAVLERTRWGRRLLGRSMREHLADALRPWEGARELGIIAGDRPIGFGRWLTPLGPAHDGTVAVDETRLVGAADHLVLPVTHMMLLYSARVAAEVRHFLACGRFAHEPLARVTSS
jgi:pimeloyl-ACP methyl ester carboxylesterase